MWGATQPAKAAAYVSLIRPLLEYACVVWNPHTSKDQLLLEQVQLRAAQWVCGSRWTPATRKWSKSSVDCVSELAWPALSARCNYLSLTLFYDIINNHQLLSLPTSIQFNRLLTKSHSLFLIPLTSSINCYRFSFFVNTIFLWNQIPYSILSLSCVPVFHRALYHYLCSYLMFYSCCISVYIVFLVLHVYCFVLVVQ